MFSKPSDPGLPPIPFIGADGNFIKKEEIKKEPKKEVKDKKKKAPLDDKAKQFREDVAAVIVNRLSRYLREGKIDKDSFKKISRKLTHKVLDYEAKDSGDYEMSDKQKAKIKQLVTDYVHKKTGSSKSKDKKKRN